MLSSDDEDHVQGGVQVQVQVNVNVKVSREVASRDLRPAATRITGAAGLEVGVPVA